MLANGADINGQDWQRNTPLLSAAMTGQVWLVRDLIRRGADLHIRNRYGETPLIAAQSIVHSEIYAGVPAFQQIEVLLQTAERREAAAHKRKERHAGRAGSISLYRTECGI